MSRTAMILVAAAALAGCTGDTDPGRLDESAPTGQEGPLAWIDEAQADADALTLTPEQALMAGAARGDVEAIQEALGAGAAVDLEVVGVQPIHVAARHGMTDAVVALLDAGANANARALGGDRVLHLAAMARDPETVTAVLAGGADVDARGGSFYEGTALHVAAGSGSFGSIDVLVDAGADLEWANRFNATPIITAAWYGQLESVQHLIALGADATYDRSGGEDDPPFDAREHARENDFDEVVAYLDSLE